MVQSLSSIILSHPHGDFIFYFLFYTTLFKAIHFQEVFSSEYANYVLMSD